MELTCDGEIREPLDGKTLHVAPTFDPQFELLIQEWFEQNYSIRFRNYPVTAEYLHELRNWNAIRFANHMRFGDG